MIKEYFGVTALCTTDKEDDVIRSRKILQFFHPICHTPAYRIMIFEIRRFFMNRFDEVLKTFDGLRRLREEVDGAGEVDAVELVDGLNDDGGVVRLALEPDDFRVSGLAVDDDLRREGLIVSVGFVARANTVLEFLDDRTGGIDDLYAALLRNPIGSRWFAMCAKEYA